ncbi:MAG: precorrin-6y C5,15-methyltransferase (decarboxylating) subunit CbiE [Pyrobaculum sp.]
MLFIIGVGPGDPSLITLRGLAMLKKCDKILAWRSVAERVRQYLEDREVYYLTYANQDALLQEAIVQSKLLDVCILAHGDPMVSDWELLERVRRGGGQPIVINGVSSINVALERLGLDLAHVVFLTHHASNPQPLDEVLLLVKKRVLLIFPPPKGLRETARVLLEKIGNCRAEVLQDLTLPSERRWGGDLVNLAVLDEEFSDLSILAVDCRDY